MAGFLSLRVLKPRPRGSIVTCLRRQVFIFHREILMTSDVG